MERQHKGEDVTTTLVKFWGARGSIPVPGHTTHKYGGNTSCVELRFGDTLFICDGGTGLRELGLDLVSRGGEPIEAHMLFSHTHWDHVQGFPFFVPAYAAQNRLYVYEPAERNGQMHRLLLGQMRSEYFPVSFADLGSEIVPRNIERGSTVVAGIDVQYWEQQHPGGSYAYAFDFDGVRVVYATDSELDRDLLDSSTRRRLPQEMVQRIAGVDLLIADAQYTEEEYASRRGWGHARAWTVVDWAIQAGVKTLALFHHDPLQSDEQMTAKVDSCRDRAARAGSDLEIIAARDGLQVEL